MTQTLLVACRYGFEGMLQAIYGFDREPLDCEHDDTRQCLFQQPDDVLRKLDVEYARFYVDFAILCSFFVALRAGCYFVPVSYTHLTLPTKRIV